MWDVEIREWGVYRDDVLNKPLSLQLTYYLSNYIMLIACIREGNKTGVVGKCRIGA